LAEEEEEEEAIEHDGKVEDEEQEGDEVEGGLLNITTTRRGVRSSWLVNRSTV
jgi:hypothetical protein